MQTFNQFLKAKKLNEGWIDFNRRQAGLDPLPTSTPSAPTPKPAPARPKPAPEPEKMVPERIALDWIHGARLEAENAVRTFQTKAWSRLRPSFVEVLDDDDWDKDGLGRPLNAEQDFFRRRLREILDALKDLGIAPGNTAFR